jgi:biotin synthase
MTGLPFQTPENLANDIIFFRDMNIDMLGMGPYIVHKNTPLAAEMPDFEKRKEKQLMLGLKMIAACRIFLKDVNIAATTALQALHESGRKMGLRAGANVIMPNITKTEYRAAYLLYEDKPAINENSSESRDSLEKNIISAGETVAYDEWGDSPHFFSRMNKS